jgi:Cyclopropane fatty acid synthase and related methyltransferases
VSFYDEIFYDNQEKGSFISASIVVPLVMSIVNPRSVIDVGCGLGTWLSVFNELGVDNILGLDGDWVDEKRLHIPKNKFKSIDLEKPININRKFDLAVSLEVGEHISKENSENYIKYLINKAPVILFSAAVPFQGGTNHINEQWPEYWIKIFKKNNYEVIDCLRAKIWGEKRIEWWYVQNMFLFVEKDHLLENQNLKDNLKHYPATLYSAVHPRLYLKQVKSHENLKNLVNELKSQKWEYESKLKDQKKFFEGKIQNFEKQRVDSFSEIKGLLDELKGQKLFYEGQLEDQRGVFEEKIQVLEMQRVDSFSEIKGLLDELKGQKLFYEGQLEDQRGVFEEKILNIEKEI